VSFSSSFSGCAFFNEIDQGLGNDDSGNKLKKDKKANRNRYVCLFT
jgi:hypothetical protein